MRRDKINTLYTDLFGDIHKRYFKPWTNIFRNRTSRTGIGLLIPTTSIAKDIIDEVNHVDHMLFPDTLYYHEPYEAWYIDNMNGEPITEENINGLIRENNLTLNIVDQTSFLSDNFEYTEIVHSIDIPEVTGVNPTTNTLESIIMFGDVRENTGVFTLYTGRYNRQFIPDRLIRFDARVIRNDIEDELGTYVFEDIESTTNKSTTTLGRGYHIVKDNIASIIDAIDVATGNPVDVKISTLKYDKNYHAELDFNKNGIIDEEDKQRLLDAVGKSVRNTTPTEWNTEYNVLELLKDGIIDQKDIDVFNRFFPSMREEGTVIYVDNENQTTITYEGWNSKTVVGSYIDNGEELSPVENITIKDEGDELFPSDTVDVSYNYITNTWYASSNTNKCIYAIRVIENTKHVSKIPLGIYYDHQVRGIKWYQGFLFVLLHKIGSTRILRYDFDNLNVETPIDDVDITHHGLVEPIGLTITDNELFVISDINKIHFLLPKRDKIWWNQDNNRLYMHRKRDLTYKGESLKQIFHHTEDENNIRYYGLWNNYDEYGLSPYGLERLPGESNIEFHERMRIYLRNIPDTTRQGIINGVNIDLGCNIYTANPPEFALKRHPQEEIEIHINENIITFTVERTDDRTFNIVQGTTTLFTVTGVALKVIDRTITGRVDVKYKTDGEEFYDPIYVPIQHIMNPPYMEVFPLIDEEVKNPLHGFYDNEGNVTSSYIDIMKEIVTSEKITYGQFITDSLYFDMFNRVPGISTFPTYYNVHDDYELIHGGIGDLEDLRLLGIESTIKSATIIEFDQDSISSLSKTTNERWFPLLRTGFFYIEDEEYYLYNRKVVQVELGAEYITLTHTPKGYTPIIIHVYDPTNTTLYDGTYFIDSTEDFSWYPFEQLPTDKIERSYDSDSSSWTLPFDSYIWDPESDPLTGKTRIRFKEDVRNLMVFIVYEAASNNYEPGANWDSTLYEEDVMPLTNPVTRGSLVISTSDDSGTIEASSITIDLDNIETEDISTGILTILDDTAIPIESKDVLFRIERELLDQHNELVEYTYVADYYNINLNYINNPNHSIIKEFDVTLVDFAHLADQQLIHSLANFEDEYGNNIGNEVILTTDKKGTIPLRISVSSYCPRIKLKAICDNVESIFYVYNKNNYVGRLSNDDPSNGFTILSTDINGLVDLSYVDGAIGSFDVYEGTTFDPQTMVSPTKYDYEITNDTSGIEPILYMRVLNSGVPVASSSVALKYKSADQIAFFGSRYG